MKVTNPVARLLIVLLLLFGIPAHAEDAAEDWVGQLNRSFKVRIHIAKANSAYSGYLTNPSGNETNLDEVASDSSHLHFAVTKLNLSYEGRWSAQQEGWTGNLTFQQVYSLTLKRATSADLARSVHKRPQEAAIAARRHRRIYRRMLLSTTSKLITVSPVRSRCLENAAHLRPSCSFQAQGTIRERKTCGATRFFSYLRTL